MKAFDVQESIRKGFAQHGAGSYPIVFECEGQAYTFENVKVEGKVVLVKLNRVKE